MSEPNKLKFQLSECCFGEVTLNGLPLNGVTAISYKAQAGELAEVTLTIMAEVDADVEVCLDKLMIEKEQMVRSESFALTDGHVRHAKAD